MEAFWLNVLMALIGVFFICISEYEDSKISQYGYYTVGVALLATALIRLWITAVLA